MKKILLLLISTLIFSCSDDDTTIVNFDAINETTIQTYLTTNNLTAEKTASGLYHIISNEGTGASPAADSNTTIAYEGYFLDGTTFDQSDNISFNLTNLILGFSEGVQLLKEGGSGTFILPSRLAYGTRGQGSIQPGDVIVFDISLFSVN